MCPLYTCILFRFKGFVLVPWDHRNPPFAPGWLNEPGRASQTVLGSGRAKPQKSRERAIGGRSFGGDFGRRGGGREAKKRGAGRQRVRGLVGNCAVRYGGGLLRVLSKRGLRRGSVPKRAPLTLSILYFFARIETKWRLRWEDGSVDQAFDVLLRTRSGMVLARIQNRQGVSGGPPY